MTTYFKDGQRPPPIPVIPDPETYKRMGESGKIKFRNLLISRLRMGLHHQLDEWLSGPGRENALMQGAMAGAHFQIRVDVLTPHSDTLDEAQRYAAADVHHDVHVDEEGG